MSNETNFIPRRLLNALNYGAHVRDKLTDPAADPALLDLSDDDVAELVALAKTKALSGPKGVHARLVAKLRAIGNKARNSQAPAGALAAIGVRRKNYHPAPVTAPADAPDFTIDGVSPGFIHVRFRVGGSAVPRARAPRTMGVQIAIVDAAKPVADGEADAAPNVFLSRNPGSLDSTKLPRRVRLSARWLTRRGQTGPWSLSVPVSVI